MEMPTAFEYFVKGGTKAYFLVMMEMKIPQAFAQGMSWEEDLSKKGHPWALQRKL